MFAYSYYILFNKILIRIEGLNVLRAILKYINKLIKIIFNNVLEEKKMNYNDIEVEHVFSFLMGSLF